MHRWWVCKLQLEYYKSSRVALSTLGTMHPVSLQTLDLHLDSSIFVLLKVHRLMHCSVFHYSVVSQCAGDGSGRPARRGRRSLNICTAH